MTQITQNKFPNLVKTKKSNMSYSRLSCIQSFTNSIESSKQKLLPHSKPAKNKSNMAKLETFLGDLKASKKLVNKDGIVLINSLRSAIVKKLLIWNMPACSFLSLFKAKMNILYSYLFMAKSYHAKEHLQPVMSAVMVNGAVMHVDLPGFANKVKDLKHRLSALFYSPTANSGSACLEQT